MNKIEFMAIFIGMVYCLLLGVWAGHLVGHADGLKKGLEVGVENCDPYLPNDPIAP